MNKIHECNDICVEHYNESEVKCPYCLEFGSDSYELLMGKDNESGKTQCGYCEKEFEYGTEITYRDGGVHTLYYTTFQIAGDE